MIQIRDGRGSIPRGLARFGADIASAREETPIERNKRLVAMHGARPAPGLTRTPLPTLERITTRCRELPLVKIGPSDEYASTIPASPARAAMPDQQACNDALENERATDVAANRLELVAPVKAESERCAVAAASEAVIRDGKPVLVKRGTSYSNRNYYRWETQQPPTVGAIADAQRAIGFDPCGYGGPDNLTHSILPSGRHLTAWTSSGCCD